MGGGSRMKDFLKDLYIRKKRDFDVWNYLWLFSDNNTIIFTQTELCGRFGLPASSLHRILNQNIENANIDRVFIEYERIAFKNYRVIFYPKGKKIRKTKYSDLYIELYDWMKDYYVEIDFDYADMPKHRRYINTICDKIIKAMRDKKTEITDENVIATFQFFIKGIDNWWRDTGNITLPLISKHFTKLLNQVKQNGTNGGKKRDSFSKAAEQIDAIDFNKLTRNT